MIRYEFLIKTPECTYRMFCPDWTAVMRLIEDCHAMAHPYGLIALHG